MKQYHNTKSFKQFKLVYEHLFEILSRADGTIFENAPVRTLADVFYKEFIKDSEGYSKYIMLKEDQKIPFLKRWIYENVFLETAYAVEYKLLQENNYELPYVIESKLAASYDIINEGLTTAGLGLLGIGTIVFGVPDWFRKNVITFFETIGRIIGKVVTLNGGDLPGLEWTGTRKEILALINAEELADGVKECQRLYPDATSAKLSSKLTRFVSRVTLNQSEYGYAKCLGNKLIAYYEHLLEVIYRLLVASKEDRRLIEVFDDNVKMGMVGIRNLRNIGRMINNRKLFAIMKNFNEVSQAIYDLIDSLIHSKDQEYVRIGHELIKDLDNAMRTASMKFNKKERPRMNERRNFSRENFHPTRTNPENNTSENKPF